MGERDRECDIVRGAGASHGALPNGSLETRSTMVDKQFADACQSCLRIDRNGLATIVRGNATVNFRGPFCGDLRCRKLAVRQALFQHIRQIGPVFGRQSQCLPGNLFAKRHESVLIQ